MLGDRHLLVVAHAGRSNDVGTAFVAQHANPALTELVSLYQKTATATQPAGFPDCTRPLPGGATPAGCSTVGGPSGNRSQPARLRRTPTSSPSASRIVGTVDGKAHTINLTQAADGAYRRYNGVDLWVQGTPGRWDLLASYTLSFTRGTVDDYFSNGGGGYLQNPRFTQFFDGYVNDDQRHTLKGSVAYKLPFGLDIGLRFQYRTGKPLWEGFTNPGDPNGTVYRSPRGTGFPVNTATGQPNFNDPNSWAELRNPDQFTLDVQARYNLGQALHLQQKLEVVALVVNSLNESTPAAFSSLYSTTTPYKFGASSFAASPLQGELIVRFRN